MHRALIDFAERAGKLDNFVIGGEAALDRRAVGVHMHGVLVRRETRGAGAHAGFEHFFHLLDFRRRGRPLDGSRAHDELAERAVPHQGRDIDAEFAAHRVEILPKRGKAPRHARLQSGKGDRFDSLEASENLIAIRLFARRQRQAAVAGNHRGDAMITRRRRQRIPQKLRIEVGVKIDEPWRHRQPIGVDDTLGAAADAAGLDDLAVLHCDVAEIRGQTAAVINSSTLDQNVVSHEDPPWNRRSLELTEATALLSTNVQLAGDRVFAIKTERYWVTILKN